MNYFVNENIFSLNSGTEFSAASRIKLFKDNGVSAKILTRNYNSHLITEVEKIGLETNDVLNMYDYFQEADNVEKKDINVRYTSIIDKNKYEIEGIDANKSLIHYRGKTIGQVNIEPLTVGLVGNVEYFDDMNNTVVQDIWDRRGFKSSTKYFHPDGKEGPQVFYDTKGNPKIEITRMNIEGTLYNTMFQLLDYKGRSWRFNTENEMFTFFMNELMASESSILINDRPSLINEVASVQGAQGKWQFLHNVHSPNVMQQGGSRKVFDYIKPLFKDHIQDFDGVIVPTIEQKQEIEKFFDFKNVVVQQDSFAEQQVRVPVANRDINKLIFVGRISPEKQPEQAIEILAEAKKHLPELHLEFYGYSADINVTNSLNELANKLGVTDSVSFNGYQTDDELNQKIQDAAGIISVSLTEAFGSNVLLAMSHGIPVFGYDVKYGMRNLVDSGKNGQLTLLNSSKKLASKLIESLKDAIQLEIMSESAYEKAQIFDEDSAWKLWTEANEKIDNLIYGVARKSVVDCEEEMKVLIKDDLLTE